MKLPALLFGLLLAMCAIVAGAIFTPEQPIVEGAARGHGYAHTRQPQMQEGGPGEERAKPILPIAFAFGLAQVLFFSGIVALGARRRERLGEIAKFLAVGLLAYIAALLALFASYRVYMRAGGADSLVLGFPAPTAIMLTAVFMAPLLFMLIYVVKFERFVFGEEDEAKFREIAESARMKREGNG